jgi:hypothetical protein
MQGFVGPPDQPLHVARILDIPVPPIGDAMLSHHFPSPAVNSPPSTSISTVRPTSWKGTE